MELDISLFEKNEVNRIIVSDKVFNFKFNENLVYQVVNSYLAGGHVGTKSQKTRREVSGGGIKPWRQKGTGRARAGSNRSPLWRSGGITFAASPRRDFSQKVNRKMYRSAIASILSELIRQKRLIVIDKLKLNEPKTREFKELLKNFNLKTKIGSIDMLIIIDGHNRNISLASRNVVGISVCDALRVDPVSLVSSKNIVVTVDGLTRLEKRLS